MILLLTYDQDLGCKEDHDHIMMLNDQLPFEI
jgi:hypothetical protein